MDKPKPQYHPKVQKALKASKFLHRWWSKRREKAKAQQTQPKREGGAHVVPLRGRDASKKEPPEN